MLIYEKDHLACLGRYAYTTRSDSHYFFFIFINPNISTMLNFFEKCSMLMQIAANMPVYVFGRKARTYFFIYLNKAKTKQVYTFDICS